MEIKLVDSTFDEKEWNKKATHPVQSWEWGETKEELKTEVVRIAEFDKKELKNVFLMTLHPLPKVSYKIGYIPRSSLPSKDVLEFLQQYGKEHKVIFIKIEPYIQKGTNALPINNHQLQRSPHPLFTTWTQILDLIPSEDDLLKNLKSKTRYNIRLAQKKGVVVKEQSDEEGFKIFSKLYFETCKRQKYFGHDMHYHQTVWNHLKKNMAHILIAYYENTPLASYELFKFHDTFYYPYGGSSMEYKNVMGANLLMWEAIKLGKKLGAERFDMWGSLPPNYDQADPWAGFTRFKEGYNTQFVEMIGSYDLVIDPTLYKLYNIAHKAREWYLKLRA